VKFILYAILIYIAWQFIFNFIIPLYKTTRKIKQGFREMQDRMNSQYNTADKQTSTTSANKQSKSPGHSDDYIDYEEVK
jgi:hypothetical protein